MTVRGHDSCGEEFISIHLVQQHTHMGNPVQLHLSPWPSRAVLPTYSLIFVVADHINNMLLHNALLVTP